jgi:hypothetical protein
MRLSHAPRSYPKLVLKHHLVLDKHLLNSGGHISLDAVSLFRIHDSSSVQRGLLQESDDLNEACSLFLLAAPVTDTTSMQTEEGSATSRAGIPSTEDPEERAGPSMEVAEGSATLKPHVEPESVSCTPIQVQHFPIQFSPFVTRNRGSSSKRSHSKCFIF